MGKGSGIPLNSNIIEKKSLRESAKWIVISLGGSLIVPRMTINTYFISEFKKVIIRRVNQGEKFIIVCGGGNIARAYQDTYRNIISEADNNILDLIGISATKLNAQFIVGVFGGIADQKVIDNPNKKITTKYPVVFAGGHMPGCSTDYVAVRFALNVGARLVINLTNTNGVYDIDPNGGNGKNAKLIKRIWLNDYIAMIPGVWTAGLKSPFDPTASREAQKRDIDVAIINGHNLKNLKLCLNGRDFKGTIISARPVSVPSLYPYVSNFKNRRLHNIKDTFIGE